ncbi:hypothetical protein JTL78_37455, partial [Pseudomonas aeruginosa]|nr:hypothetical protein [Pseudomonas aeruginosa]
TAAKSTSAGIDSGCGDSLVSPAGANASEVAIGSSSDVAAEGCALETAGSLSVVGNEAASGGIGAVVTAAGDPSSSDKPTCGESVTVGICKLNTSANV